MKNTSVIIAAIAVLAIAGGAFALTRDSDKPADSTATTNQTTPETSDTTNTEDSDQPTNTSETTITYSDEGFSPGSLTVKAGTTVTIKNDSSKLLQFSSNQHPEHTDDPELNLDSLSPGKSLTFTPTKTGSHGFHNHLNDGHKGTLVVQ